MLQEKVIDRALREPITTDRSRCLRMRFNKITCSLCLEQCRSGAISIREDVTINADNCSECMLCSSVCPSGCFEINGFDFYSTINRIKKIETSVQSPVIGCGRNNPKFHIRTFCLGYLSEEFLIAMYVYIMNPVQIDLTGCAGCNDFIPSIIESRLENIEAATGINMYEKIRLVKEISSIDFREVSYNRRNFFKAIKDMTFIHTSGLLSNDDHIKDNRAYSTKKVPLKREVLNNTIKLLPTEIRRAVLSNYYYSADITGECDNCFACIGMCPTGALKAREATNSDRELFFNSSLCIGCGLCSNICRNGAISVRLKSRLMV